MHVYEPHTRINTCTHTYIHIDSAGMQWPSYEIYLVITESGSRCWAAVFSSVTLLHVMEWGTTLPKTWPTFLMKVLTCTGIRILGRQAAQIAILWISLLLETFEAVLAEPDSHRTIFYRQKNKTGRCFPGVSGHVERRLRSHVSQWNPPPRVLLTFPPGSDHCLEKVCLVFWSLHYLLAADGHA